MGCVDNTHDINMAIAAELRAAKGASKLSVRVLVEKTGIATATLNRLLNGERDIRVTQLYLLTDALDVSPVQVVERALERVAAEREKAEQMSQVPSNVTPLRPVTAAGFDAYTGDKAAYRDDEADTDEPE